MYLHVQFESGQSRDIPVSRTTVLTVADARTDVFALQDVAAMFLTSDRGETQIGPGASAEAVARSVGWVTPEAAKELQDRVGHLEYRLRQAEQVGAQLQAQLDAGRPSYPVTVQGGAGEEARALARQRAAEEAERLNAEADLPSGEDAVWADPEPEIVA